MGKKIKTFLYVCIIMVLLPLVITMIFQKDTISDKSKYGESVMQQEDTQQKLIGNEDLEGKVIAILAKQISVNSHKEAIKAQAVIARTNLVGSKLAGESEPEGLTTDQMMKLFGETSFNRCYEKMAECVQDTAGLIMVYNNRPIDAAYFAISAGATRSAEDAFGEKQIPYLTRTISKQDIEAEDFLSVKNLSTSDFVSQCKQAYPDCDLKEEDIESQIEICSRDNSEYVKEIKLSNITVNGEEFRNKLKLNSACFTLKEVEGKIRIVTKGLGHGVGLSQYGAEVMAEKGKDYKQILRKYYSNIDMIGYYNNCEEPTEN